MLASFPVVASAAAATPSTVSVLKVAEAAALGENGVHFVVASKSGTERSGDGRYRGEVKRRDLFSWRVSFSAPTRWLPVRTAVVNFH